MKNQIGTDLEKSADNRPSPNQGESPNCFMMADQVQTSTRKVKD